MKELRHMFFASCLAFSASLFSFQASAQFSELDAVATRVAEKLKEQKPHMIGVATFTAPDGSRSEQGDYFAWSFAAALSDHVKKVAIADIRKFNQDLLKAAISTRDLDSQDALKKVASEMHVDVIIIGTIETLPKSYGIRVTVRRTYDAQQLMEETTDFQRTDFTDSLSGPFPPQTDYPIVQFSGGGPFDKERIPTCVHCPIPSFNGPADRGKIQGTSTFEVLISSSGTVVAAHPVKLLGHGRDEQAFETIKRWRFRPATDTDGKPIAAIVPVEVSVHSF